MLVREVVEICLLNNVGAGLAPPKMNKIINKGVEQALPLQYLNKLYKKGR